jgi:hypothetical protein
MTQVELKPCIMHKKLNKMGHRLKRTKAIKLLEECLTENLSDLELGKTFY